MHGRTGSPDRSLHSASGLPFPVRRNRHCRFGCAESGAAKRRSGKKSAAASPAATRDAGRLRMLAWEDDDARLPHRRQCAAGPVCRLSAACAVRQEPEPAQRRALKTRARKRTANRNGAGGPRRWRDATLAVRSPSAEGAARTTGRGSAGAGEAPRDSNVQPPSLGRLRPLTCGGQVHAPAPAARAGHQRGNMWRYCPPHPKKMAKQIGLKNWPKPLAQIVCWPGIWRARAAANFPRPGEAGTVTRSGPLCRNRLHFDGHPGLPGPSNFAPAVWRQRKIASEKPDSARARFSEDTLLVCTSRLQTSYSRRFAPFRPSTTYVQNVHRD